jgi:hypothetical protein
MVVGGVQIGAGSTGGPPGIIIGVLAGFVEAYGPLVFIAALIAGGTIAYMWYSIVIPRLVAMDKPPASTPEPEP